MDTTTKTLRLLIVEDNPYDAELITRELERAGFNLEAQRVETEADYLAALNAVPLPNLILSDYYISSHFNGLRAFTLLQQRQLDIPFILVSGMIGEEPATEVIRQGADDYLLKDRLARLGAAVATALDLKRLRVKARLTEFRLQRLNRLHIVLSKVNTAIVRARDRQTIYDTVCRIVVEDGGLRMVFVADVDAEAKLARPVAAYGAGQEYLLELTSMIPTDGGLRSPGTVGTAIRTDRYDFCNDIANAARMKPWHEAAQKNGLLANASFPLTLNGATIAVMVLYAGETDYFLEDEIALMISVAEAVSLALAALDKEQLRQQAAENLAANAAILQQFVQHTPAAVAMLDMNMRYIEVSERWMQDYHLGDREIIGKSHYEIFPDTPEFWKDIHQRVLAGAVDRCDEAAFPRADGSTEWLQWEVRPWRKGGGEIGGLIMFTQVITARKQSEEALRHSEERFRSMFTSTATGIAISTPDGRYLQANAAYCQMLGYTEKELQTLKFSSLTHPEDLPLNLEMRDEMLAGQRESFVMEKRYLKKNGDIVWTRHSVSALRATTGDVMTLMVVAEDITERKRAELALQELSGKTERRERMLTTTLSSLKDFAYSFDRDGRFLFANQPLLNLWGITLEQVVGRNFFDLGYPADLATKLQRQIQEVFETKQHVIDETSYTSPAGDVGEYEYIFSPALMADGTVEVVVGSTRNITERKQAEAALLLKQTELRVLFDLMPAMLCFKDTENVFVRVNRRMAEATGISVEEMEGKSALELYPQEAAKYYADDLAVLHSREPKLGIVEIMRSTEGDARWVQTDKVPYFDKDDEAIGLVVMIQDITERKQAELRINYLNRVYAMLSGINTLIVRVHDREQLFRDACRIAHEAGGFAIAWIGLVDREAKKIVPIASSGADNEYLTAIKEIFSSTESMVYGKTLTARAIREKKAVVANDSENDPSVMLSELHSKAGVRSIAALPLVVADAAVGVIVLYAGEKDFFHQDEMKLLEELADDISFAMDHIEKQDRLNYLAFYDDLTGLANRSLFLERVSQYMRSAAHSGHKLALLLIDLERFKYINDSLGRSTGDTLLRQVAEWLTHHVEDVNLVTRLTADRFAVVLPTIRQEDDVIRFLDKAMTALQHHPFRLNDAEFRIDAKAGIALFPDDSVSAETLLGNAEAALKKAKASGDRYLFYTQKMNSTVAGKLALENQLRKAIDNHEFILHYQPKIDIRSQRLIGMEALIRWINPVTGLIPPGEFIPLMEETGLILEVGKWVMQQAVSDYAQWVALGLKPPRIAVNVSPLQVRNRDFIADIKQAIGNYRHAVDGLALEITESLFMENFEECAKKLQAIRDMGIEIAVDDFGTGYSSLSYISKLPFDALKIDRSFVNNMTSDPNSMSIVSMVITLAHALNLKVIAEGVETEEQSNMLKLLRCDQAQGYLFGKPMPREIFETKYLYPVLIK